MRLPPHTFAALALTTLAALGVGIFAYRNWLPSTVEVTAPVRGPAVEAVYATGAVEPSVMLPIATRLASRLVELAVDEGERVRAGQVLGRLEHADLLNALAQARAQEAFAKDELDRDAALLGRGLIARAMHDKARADWRAASAARAKAAAELRFADLVSPVDGTIVRRDGEVGQLIAANVPVFWVAADSPPRVTADVDEEDIVRVSVGQAVLVRADAFGDRVFRAHVQALTPKGDPTARTYRVRIAFDEAVPLLTGMTAEADIIVREVRDALLVPTTAVVAGRVWCVRAGRLQPQSVDVGVRGEARTEIRSGVAIDDVVVVDPPSWATPGRRVRVSPVPPPGAIP
ncbi:MAG TPA: efflux RND transporter periplasmic adaptor subunit [Dokdonella sp.]|nr:efflux RND transporter periplasmic adaptor subunit [Dokdonella sp.]